MTLCDKINEELNEAIPRKVKVPSKDSLLAVFPKKVNSDPIDNVKFGKLINMVVATLYIKALLGEDEISTAKIAPKFDKKKVYQIYQNVMLDIADYEKR